MSLNVSQVRTDVAEICPNKPPAINPNGPFFKKPITSLVIELVVACAIWRNANLLKSFFPTISAADPAGN